MSSLSSLTFCHLNNIEFVHAVKIRITKKQMLPGRASERLILPFRRSTINEIFNVNTWSHHENVKVIKKRSPRPLRDSYYLSDDYSLAWRVFAVIINFVNDAVKFTMIIQRPTQILKHSPLSLFWNCHYSQQSILPLCQHDVGSH